MDEGLSKENGMGDVIPGLGHCPGGARCLLMAWTGLGAAWAGGRCPRWNEKISKAAPTQTILGLWDNPLAKLSHSPAGVPAPRCLPASNLLWIWERRKF